MTEKAKENQELSIYAQMVAAGVQVDNHETDLYALVNEDSKRIVDGYRFKNNVTTFVSPLDGKPWYDIPFAFDPAWEKSNTLYDNRPSPSTPYQRMRWQQENCTEDVIGYAVGLASERTERAAYLTTEGKMTNIEREAAVLPKEKATELMQSILTSDNFVEWMRKGFYEIAFLVPVSATLPLTMCTFSGY